MKMTRLAADLILIALLAAIPLSSAWATTRADAEDAIAKAEAMHEKAVAANAADNQAAEMIEEAKSLLPSHQYTKAKMIAYWAIRQAEFAMQVSSGETTVEADKAAQAESLIAAAEAAREKAASVDGEWRDTAKMIKSAQTLAGAGEFDKAIEIAAAAEFQAKRGYEQAMAEKDADFPQYMLDAVK
ncbi:MAG: hypothetical protein LJE69_02795 [Thiohalocapsa sp.]|uniref:hypothetical protein n=1 Tax=Thiohalocapsa sp. TaxID=2497641 RepID=UPI0025CE670D|nr:hypothetical protein [Thiohalocapsa sp.]MCG6940161.1 hypothetical protein [Thiohalocapsa sp.]